MLQSRFFTIAATAAFLSMAAPAAADDSSAKTGLFAGLGFAAASGKSTLGDGAGSIEASLLVAEPLLIAGRTIRQVIGDPDRDVLIVTKSDTVDYSMAIWLIARIEALKTSKDTLERSGIACMKPLQVVEQQKVTGRLAPGAAAGDGTTDTSDAKTTSKLAFAPSDFAAAVSTETSIGQIKISFEDRELVDAIMLGGNADGQWRNAAEPIQRRRSADINAKFTWLSLPKAPNPASGPIKNLGELQSWADGRRGCTGDEYKAMVGSVDAFVTGATASDKGTPALAIAAEFAPKGYAGLPLILRVAIDDMGGTSVTRSSIWYSAGLPGAVQVTSGLRVSFSLWDPKTGKNLVGGVVRCATRPTSYRDVRKILVHRDQTGEDPIADMQKRLTTCAYRTT